MVACEKFWLKNSNFNIKRMEKYTPNTLGSSIYSSRDLEEIFLSSVYLHDIFALGWQTSYPITNVLPLEIHLSRLKTTITWNQRQNLDLFTLNSKLYHNWCAATR